MEIDLPEVVAEVRAEFDRYEKALGDERRRDAQRDVPPRSAHHPLRRHRESLRLCRDRGVRSARSPAGLRAPFRRP